MPGPASVEEMGAKVDYQVAAPAELRTPNLHRAKIAQPKSADGRMATEAAWLEDKELTGRKKKNRLDTHRPSHGRMATEAAWLEDKELTGRKKKNRLDTQRPSHGRMATEATWLEDKEL